MERYDWVNLHDLLSKNGKRAETSKVQTVKIGNSHFYVVFQKNFSPIICCLDMELKLGQRKVPKNCF